GLAPDPLRALLTLLAGLHDPAGRIALPGFYRRVQDRLTPRAPGRRHRGCAGPRPAHHLAAWHRLAGQPDMPADQAGSRPSLTGTGLRGGPTGPGASGTIPSRAVARISIRLVPNQQPDEITARLHQYIVAMTPPVVRSRLTLLGSAHPVNVPLEQPP